MSVRYLEAGNVTLPSRAPLFVEGGHCQWCKKELTGRAKYYCQKTLESLYSNMSDCAAAFLNWWCSRPAYVRATFIKDDFICQVCGLRPMRVMQPWLPDISRLEADHIIPLARGGETEMANLQTLCKRCNRRKGTAMPGNLRQGRLELVFAGKGGKYGA